MFTPEEIEARAFVMVRRGYDPDEVGAFLRAVAEDVRRMQDDLAAAGRKADPLDSAMTDAVAIVQSARESAARIEAQAEQRAADRLRDLEDEVARRMDRARSEARAQLDEARDQAAAILEEANARKTLAEADIAAARTTWLREAAELDVLARRRRTVLEEAQDSLEQWMSALRDIVIEAQATAPAQRSDETAYPVEPVHDEVAQVDVAHVEAEVPVQEPHSEEPQGEPQHTEHHHEHQVYEGA